MNCILKNAGSFSLWIFYCAQYVNCIVLQRREEQSQPEWSSRILVNNLQECWHPGRDGTRARWAYPQAPHWRESHPAQGWPHGEHVSIILYQAKLEFRLLKKVYIVLKQSCHERVDYNTVFSTFSQIFQYICVLMVFVWRFYQICGVKVNCQFSIQITVQFSCTYHKSGLTKRFLKFCKWQQIVQLVQDLFCKGYLWNIIFQLGLQQLLHGKQCFLTE